MSVIYSPPQFTFLRMQLSLYCSMHVMRSYPFWAGSQHAPYTIFGQAYPRGRLVCCLHSHFLCAHLPSKRNLRINGNFLLCLIWKKKSNTKPKNKTKCSPVDVSGLVPQNKWHSNGITFNFKNNWPCPTGPFLYNFVCPIPLLIQDFPTYRWKSAGTQLHGTTCEHPVVFDRNYLIIDFFHLIGL